MCPQATNTEDAWRLECRALSVRRGGRSIISNVNLSLGPAECVSIIGPNGSGKTTLLLALLGLLPPAEGEVLLDGRSLQHLSARERGRFAAYVPQVLGGAPAFSVYDTVAGGRYPHATAIGALAAGDRAVIERMLERCGLTALAGRTLDTLSGGERQKTLLAAAMTQEPQVLFLDEPSTALDPAYQVELARILRAWNADGRSLVLVSHELQLPTVLGGRVIALRAGRIAATGTTSEVLNAERLRAIYGAPFQPATAGHHTYVLPQWD